MKHSQLTVYMTANTYTQPCSYLLMLVLHFAVFGLHGIRKRVCIVSTGAPPQPFNMISFHQNEHREGARPWTDLAKSSKMRSNLGVEQNSAARFTTFGGIGFSLQLLSSETHCVAS